MTNRFMGVTRHIGIVRTSYADFRVFKTGDPKYYLFCMLDKNGCDTGIHHPILKTRLKNEVKSALANGCGIDARKEIQHDSSESKE
jgi:hypothetical protein